MTLADDLAAFRAKTESKMERAFRKIVIDAYSDCILMSPVKSGRFRGNWQTAIDVIPAGTLERLDPSGQIAIADVTNAALVTELGNTVYMANNLPYAERLEDGWSKQAPAGMVKLTIQRWQPIANAVIAQIGAE